MCPLAAHLWQCQRSLCLNPVSVLLLLCSARVKLKAASQEESCGKNILRIGLKSPLKLQMNLSQKLLIID